MGNRKCAPYKKRKHETISKYSEIFAESFHNNDFQKSATSVFLNTLEMEGVSGIMRSIDQAHSFLDRRLRREGLDPDKPMVVEDVSGKEYWKIVKDYIDTYIIGNCGRLMSVDYQTRTTNHFDYDDETDEVIRISGNREDNLYKELGIVTRSFSDQIIALMKLLNIKNKDEYTKEFREKITGIVENHIKNQVNFYKSKIHI